VRDQGLQGRISIEQVVDALQEVQFLHQRDERGLLLELLRDMLGPSFDPAEYTRARLHLYSIVMACDREHDGLRALADAVRQLDPELPAVKHLVEDHGIDVELIDLRTLRPLDTNTIVESIKKTNRCIIVDEDWGYCGMGSGILYKIQKAAFDYLDAPIDYVHSDEIPVPFNHYLEEAMMPSVDRIVAAVKEACYR